MTSITNTEHGFTRVYSTCRKSVDEDAKDHPRAQQLPSGAHDLFLGTAPTVGLSASMSLTLQPP